MQIFNFALLLDYQIAVTILSIFIAWKWGDWRNWQKYYPTILFFIVGDFSYAILTYNYPLWEFESPLLKTTGSDFLISMIFFSATIITYLTHFPDGKAQKLFYVLVWVIIFTVIESISHFLGFFSYHNGWSIWWSALFNLMMFPLLRLHYKKPPFAWIVSIVAGFSILFYFKVPFSLMK